jgi:hypothetical protein
MCWMCVCLLCMLNYRHSCGYHVTWMYDHISVQNHTCLSPVIHLLTQLRRKIQILCHLHCVGSILHTTNMLTDCACSLKKCQLRHIWPRIVTLTSQFCTTAIVIDLMACAGVHKTFGLYLWGERKDPYLITQTVTHLVIQPKFAQN